MFRKILLCTDGSESALKATQVAGALARKFDAALTVMHVFQTPVEFAGLTTDAAAIEKAARESREEIARQTARVLEEFGELPYTFRQETGYPAEVIVCVAEEERFDLIVLGRRGLGAFTAFFLGSVSDRVTQHAPCAVLVVK